MNYKAKKNFQLTFIL